MTTNTTEHPKRGESAMMPSPIDEKLKTALKFIPKGWGNQNELRYMFVAQRKRDLGAKGDGCSAYESLQRCLPAIRKKHHEGLYKFDAKGLKTC